MCGSIFLEIQFKSMLGCSRFREFGVIITEPLEDSLLLPWHLVKAVDLLGKKLILFAAKYDRETEVIGMEGWMSFVSWVIMC